MDVRPIHDSEDHAWALDQIGRYFDQKLVAGSPDADRFEILISLVEAYEARTYPMPELDSVEALTAFMESAGKTQADLAELLGSRSRASEILNRKRALTIEAIYALHKGWGVPAELLIVPSARAA